MPAWIISIFPLFRQYGKYIAVVVFLVVIFYGGMRYERNKYERKELELAQEVAEQIAQREREIRDEYAKQQEVDAEARLTLQRDLATIRQREKHLLEQLRTAELVKPADKVVVERIKEIPGECPQVIANPFSDDFVRLWNDASRND